MSEIHHHLPDQEVAEGLMTFARLLLRRLRGDLPPPLGHADISAPVDAVIWQEIGELRATPGQFGLLRVLVDQGRCTMQELADHLAVTPSTATAMVKRLVAQGYVARERDETDWRVVWVKATDSGRAAVARYDGVRLASLQRRLARLSAAERVRLEAALPALYHLIEGKS